ncbi:MAG: peptidylprolyl isomerase [Kiritimatiellae bacterium]|nr:peptidylprolyl isomerase [Kiritimatiellia bacterium]
MKTAVVNGQEILAEAVNFELDRLVRFYMGHGMTMAEIRQNLPKLEAKALDQAIGAKLLLDQAARLDIPVTEKDIDAEVARVVQQVGGEENYKKALDAQGISEADFRKELEKGARVNMLVNQACAHVADPTEDEVTAFYEAHKAEYVEPPQVLCQHILVKGSNDAALDKIKEIRERIVNDKADFAEEAKKHSDCPSGAQGGSLGWFGRGMMVPEFDKAAFEMKKGEVSGVVTTEFGYHIIYKADEKGGGQPTIVDVHDQIKDLLRHEARGKAMDAYVADLREKATIEYKDVKHECSCGHDHDHGHDCGCGHHGK